jgi:hypothetical protein
VAPRPRDDIDSAFWVLYSHRATPSGSVLAIVDYGNELLDLTFELRRRNRQGINRLRRVEQFLGLTRTCRGFVELLHIGADPSGRDPDSNPYGRLRRASRRLANKIESQLCDDTSPLTPLARTHPGVADGIERQAERVLAQLMDAPTVALAQQLWRDCSLDDAAKNRLMCAVRTIMAAAVREVSFTGRHAELADHIAEAIEADGAQTDMLSFVCNLGSIASGAFGQLPGPDALSVSLLMTVATQRLPFWSLARTRFPGLNVRLQRYFHRAAGFDSDEASLFDDYVYRSWSSTDAALREQSLERARNMLSSRLQSGVGINAVLALVGILQLYDAIASLDDDHTPLAERLNNLAASALSAATGTIWVLGRNGGLTCVPLAAVRTRLSVLAEFLEMASVANVVSTAFAVSSIIGGALVLSSEPDPWEYCAGWAQVGSGVLIAMGVLLGVPGAQPLGVALGIVAAGISLRNAFRAPSKIVLSSVLEQLRAHHVILMNLDAMDDLDALCAAVGDTSFSRSVASTGDSYLSASLYYRGLRNLGLDDETARALIDSDFTEGQLESVGVFSYEDDRTRSAAEGGQ